MPGLHPLSSEARHVSGVNPLGAQEARKTQVRAMKSFMLAIVMERKVIPLTLSLSPDQTLGTNTLSRGGEGTKREKFMGRGGPFGLAAFGLRRG